MRLIMQMKRRTIVSFVRGRVCARFTRSMKLPAGSCHGGNLSMFTVQTTMKIHRCVSFYPSFHRIQVALRISPPVLFFSFAIKPDMKPATITFYAFDVRLILFHTVDPGNVISLIVANTTLDRCIDWHTQTRFPLKEAKRFLSKTTCTKENRGYTIATRFR